MMNQIRERHFEVSKLYQLGLKDYLFHRKRQEKLSNEVVQKMKRALLRHHKTRTSEIMHIRDLETRLDRIEKLITQYQEYCFVDLKDSTISNQYMQDLFTIKMKHKKKISSIMHSVSPNER